jgi:YVTN family beta-propeller protein
VTVFDLDTLKVKQEVKTSGDNPDAIVYEPVSHKLYTFNGKSANVSVFDAASMKVLATIKVGGKPEFVIADGAGKIYLNIEDKAEIDVIDLAGDKRVATWPLASCDEPTGIALDARHARLFSVCQNKRLVVTDAASGKRVDGVAIGAHPDAVIYEGASATVFASNGDGSLSVIEQVDADQYRAQGAVATMSGARTMAMDGASGTIYLPTVADKSFTVLVLAH